MEAAQREAKIGNAIVVGSANIPFDQLGLMSLIA